MLRALMAFSPVMCDTRHVGVPAPVGRRVGRCQRGRRHVVGDSVVVGVGGLVGGWMGP